MSIRIENLAVDQMKLDQFPQSVFFAFVSATLMMCVDLWWVEVEIFVLSLSSQDGTSVQYKDSVKYLACIQICSHQKNTPFQKASLRESLFSPVYLGISFRYFTAWRASFHILIHRISWKAIKQIQTQCDHRRVFLCLCLMQYKWDLEGLGRGHQSVTSPCDLWI